jgi:hypothetical protein
MLLSAFMPWAIMPLLMVGGVFLCFEGYEKVHDIVVPHHGTHDAKTPAAAADAVTLENETVAGAIRTDFILSAEIMAISLASTATESIVMQGLVLLAVSLLVTAGVYGVVAIIVKMDDVGVYLAQRRNTTTRAIGRATVWHAAVPQDAKSRRHCSHAVGRRRHHRPRASILRNGWG